MERGVSVAHRGGMGKGGTLRGFRESFSVVECEHDCSLPGEHALPSDYAYDVNPTEGYHPTFNDGISSYTSPGGYFAANGYGLYDMTGNVSEWCWDWRSSIYYGSSPSTVPLRPARALEQMRPPKVWLSSRDCSDFEVSQFSSARCGNYP